MERKELIYCAHSGETIKYSGYIFVFVYGKGYLPVDPFFTLPYYIATLICAEGNKEQCIKDTISLMLGCAELWIFGKGPEDFLEKGGVRKEVEVWKKEKGEESIKYFTWQEVGVPKYIPGSAWHD